MASAACALWLVSASCGRPARSPTLVPRAQLSITPADADVFAFEIEVRATLDGPGQLAACSFVRGGTRVAANANASARLPLETGPNLVSVHCTTADGVKLQPAEARYTVRLPDTPQITAHLRVEGGESLLLQGTAQKAHATGPEPVAFEWFRVAGEPARERLTSLGKELQLTLPLPSAAGDHTYLLQVRDAKGGLASAQTVLRVGQGKPHEKRPGELPAWLPGRVVYGVIPPLFGAPPLDAVTAALAGLRELGVAALWLSPIFTTTSDDYGYAVTDSFQVRPDFGDLAALSRLVNEAHRHNLRILLDLVPNHTSAQHPYFRQANALGARSHYFEFYARDAQGAATHYFDWENLPNLNYTNPEVVSFSLLTAEYWLGAADIDGYRVDAAWGVQQRNPGFWPVFTRRLHALNPHVFLLAEASATDAAYIASGFDAAYDWSAELGHHAWEHVFDQERGIVQRLHRSLTQSASTPLDRVFRSLNNNDTGARFITKHGEPLTRVATAALLTLPGVPCLYSFDEVGAEYEPYQELAPIQRENAALRTFHQRLIALRRDQPALHGAGFEALHVGERDEVYAYLRRDERGARQMLVVLSFAGQKSELSLTLPKTWSSPTLRDVLSGRTVKLQKRRLELALEPWAVRIFVR